MHVTFESDYKIVINQKTFDIVVYKMSAISSRPQCVEWTESKSTDSNHYVTGAEWRIYASVN